jgi:hypothetical protein
MFQVVGKEKVLIAQPLVTELTFFFKPDKHTLVWNMSLGGTVHALVVCFANDEEEENFKQFWSLSYHETGSGIAASKMAEGDQRWAVQASEAGEDEDEPMEDGDYDEEAERSGRLSTRDLPESTYEGQRGIRVGGVAGAQAAAAASASAAAAAADSGRNDNLAVGQLLNRTFVNRGSQLGVFKHGEDGLLEYGEQPLHIDVRELLRLSCLLLPRSRLCRLAACQ